MGLIRSRVGYDRTRILDAAARARSRKKRERAIALYRWVLAAEPKNLELHGKLGPLLAESGQHFDAWSSFRTVARLHLRAGETDNALAAYREAALYLPQEVQAWQASADFRRSADSGVKPSRPCSKEAGSSARAGCAPRRSTCCVALATSTPGTSRW